MRTPLRTAYAIEVSSLLGKILKEACKPWGIPCYFGGIDGRTVFIDRDKIDMAVRALKLHQIEYTVHSKKRKWVKELIRQIEQVRSPFDDK